jgi:DNA-binding NtrC family response regulator
MVPPLRDRPEDVFPLLEHFLAIHHHSGLTFDAESRDLLQRYSWPGNIRELSNVASYLSFMAGDCVSPEVLPHYLLDAPLPSEEVPVPHCGLERTRWVLAALSGLPAGRMSLGRTLAAQGHLLSEGEIRGILRTLSEAGLIRSKVGRRGSELTPKGIALLNRLISGK